MASTRDDGSRSMVIHWLGRSKCNPPRPARNNGVMEHLLVLVDNYGYALLFGLGFLEFIGFPIASTPLIVLAGALASGGALHPLAALGSIVLGALVADTVWYTLARWRGRRLVERVCGLTSHPRACVFSVTSRLDRFGARYLLAAKLLPGVGHLSAPAAGFAGIRARTFLPLDGAGLTLWAGAYLAAGWMFAPWVIEVVRWIEGATRGALAAVVVLVAVAGVWRFLKIRRHGARHATATPAPTAPSLVPASEASARP